MVSWRWRSRSICRRQRFCRTLSGADIGVLVLALRGLPFLKAQLRRQRHSRGSSSRAVTRCGRLPRAQAHVVTVLNLSITRLVGLQPACQPPPPPGKYPECVKRCTAWSRLERRDDAAEAVPFGARGFRGVSMRRLPLARHCCRAQVQWQTWHSCQWTGGFSRGAQWATRRDDDSDPLPPHRRVR